jgi:hypothetical protein
MSFHKRFYNWDLITNFIESGDFQEFDRWLLGPDAQMFQDPVSHDFFKAYVSLDENLREYFFDAVKKESYEFSMELIKCINVVFNNDNSLLHEDSLDSYTNLFYNKWEDKADEYKLLITKK